ncbi:MAG TPA: hypothetical protein V6D23_03820 [Candidatus Obscuribacterales bacterium]
MGPKTATGSGGYQTGIIKNPSQTELAKPEVVDLTAVGKEQNTQTENHMSQELGDAIGTLQGGKDVTLVLSGYQGSYETVKLDANDPKAIKFLQDLKAKVDTHQFDLTRLWFRDIGQKAPGMENADGSLRQYSLVAEFKDNSKVAQPYNMPKNADLDLSHPNPFAHSSTQTQTPPPTQDPDLRYDRSFLNSGSNIWPGKTHEVGLKLDDELNRVQNTLSNGRKLTDDERLAIAVDFVGKQGLNNSEQQQVIQNMFNGCSLKRSNAGWFEGGKPVSFVPIPSAHQGLDSNQRLLDSKPDRFGVVDKYQLSDVQTDKYVTQAQTEMSKAILDGMGIPAGKDPVAQVKALMQDPKTDKNQAIQYALRGLSAFKGVNQNSAFCKPANQFTPLDQYAMQQALGIQVNPDTFTAR